MTKIFNVRLANAHTWNSPRKIGAATQWRPGGVHPPASPARDHRAGATGCEFTLRVQGIIMGLIGILPELGHVKAAHIHMRIFAAIIPTEPNPGHRRAAHQRNRVGHHIRRAVLVARDADLGFQTELNNGMIHV